MNLDLTSWQILLAQVMKMKMALAMCLNSNFRMSLPCRVTTFKCVSLRGKNKYRAWGKNSWDDLLGMAAVCVCGEIHLHLSNVNERAIPLTARLFRNKLIGGERGKGWLVGAVFWVPYSWAERVTFEHGFLPSSQASWYNIPKHKCF